ncbi:MAG: cation-translocating P-type ATPase [Promethearchaeota archaeon]
MTEDILRENWHTLEIKEVLAKVNSNIGGLSEEEAKKRLEIYGYNEFESEEKVTPLKLFLQQILNPLVAILLVAVFVSLLAGKYLDTVVVAVVIVANSIIGFYQEYKAEQSLEKLKSLAAPESYTLRECDVNKLRTCIATRVKTREIVPGDILILEAGDKVPADARIFENVSLEIDESMLTGESNAVRKNLDLLETETPIGDRKNLVFSGTIILKGRGKAVVTNTGMNTEMGKIAQLIKDTESAEDPIKKRTRALTTSLGFLAISTTIITIVVMSIRGFEILEMFNYALAMTVSSIPEGLPAVITITLAVAVNRMASRNAIIRRLPSIDTLGVVDTIVTDKTGTLTANKMTVTKIYINDSIFEVTGVGYTPKGDFILNNEVVLAEKVQNLHTLLQAATLCNDARLRREKLSESQVLWDIVGDPTEGALEVLAAKSGIGKEKLEEELPRIDEIPFNSSIRFMATFHESLQENGKIRVYVKGAPKRILSMSSHIQKSKFPEELSEKNKEEILQVNRNLADEALRVLAIAYQEIDPEEVGEFKEALCNRQEKLIFVGYVAMKDPARPEVEDALRLCESAGIRVIMATGDQLNTAKAIGRELRILKEGNEVLTGRELDTLSEEEFLKRVDNISIFARVSPEHKFRIVTALQMKGKVVAMTGDGVNDAPALKASEFGIGMGITGTDVTKETADMILADDNFATIVGAVEEGRIVFENLQKVVKYVTTTTIGEIGAILLALLLLPAGTPIIITAIQVLWINLVAEGFLDIALALEPKDFDVMNRKPRNKNENILTKGILRDMFYSASFMMVGTFLVFIFALSWYPNTPLEAQSLAFTTMTVFQFFNALNCRSLNLSIFTKGLFSNKYLITAFAAASTLQIAAIYVLNPFLGTVPLTLFDWFIVIGVTLSVFIGDEIRKYYIKRKRK